MVGKGRGECVGLLGRVPIQGPLYVATMDVMDDIDGVAETLTGDRRLFHLKPNTTPGPRFEERE